MMDRLTDHLHNYFECTPDTALVINSLFIPKNLPKGKVFIRRGQYNGGMCYIRSGFLRMYRLSEGKEVTQWMSGPGEFVADLSDLAFGLPARWEIIALTDCEILHLPADAYQALSEKVKNWPATEKKFLAKCFITIEERVFSLLSMSAEERYDWFLSERRELTNYVPLQYLASMLGMSPETLSRIRNKKLS